MNNSEYTFTPWFHWTHRSEMPGLVAPGVYAIVRSAENIAGKAFDWQQDIIYFGVSGSLKMRLRQFDNTISHKRKSHGGADRVRFKHPDYDLLVPDLYVSVLAVGDTPAKDSSDCWRRIGDAKRLEYYCIAEYLDRYGSLPEFNRQDAPKLSRAQREG